MSYKNVAIEAVKEAGKILIDNLGEIQTITDKGIKDYVTNVDIETEKKIKKIIKGHFPHHSIVAEESEIEKRNTDYVWFLDPLSSTVNYIHNLPHFAVALCLQEKNDLRVSTVFDPFYNELFIGEKNKGAFLNNKLIKVSTISTMTKALVFVNFHPTDERQYLKTITSQFLDIRRIGSTALQFCYVACGRGEAHIDTRSDVFAIPAGKLILEEAGGRVTDFEDKKWNAASSTTLASNGKIHKELVKLLTQNKLY